MGTRLDEKPVAFSTGAFVPSPLSGDYSYFFFISKCWSTEFISELFVSSDDVGPARIVLIDSRLE